MNPRRMHRAMLVSLLVSLAGGGCVRVKPWERDALADYTMRPQRDPLTSSTREHLWYSREAANGGHTIGVGGCGCN